MITRSLLRRLRSDLPMPYVFTQLGKEAPYSKQVDGRFRFICPHCNELMATLNPKNNLAHCFCCHKNINNIDLMMLLGYSFLDAVNLLDQWHQCLSKNKPPGKERKRSDDQPHRLKELLFDVLRA